MLQLKKNRIKLKKKLTPKQSIDLQIYQKIVAVVLQMHTCHLQGRFKNSIVQYRSSLYPQLQKINLDEYSLIQYLYEKYVIKLDLLENLMKKYGNIDLNQIGKIKKEEFKTISYVKEKCEWIIPEIMRKEFNVSEESQEINETNKMMSKISCLVNAGNGVGKTYLCARLTEYLGNQKYLGLYFTNLTVDNLSKQGIKNVQKFDSFFDQHSKERKLQQKKRFRVKLFMFGNFNQCRPVEENCYDYLNNKILKEMVDFNLMKVKYKSISRFEDETLKNVNKLLDGHFEYENLSEDEFQETDEVDLSVRDHISLTNKINKMMFEEYFNQWIII